MAAADKGHAEVVKTLLDHNANATAVDHQKKSAIAYAEANDHQDVVALLQSARATSGRPVARARGAAN